jgi:ATP-binding cassette subfamily A (ABC1) protein 3
MAFFRQLMTLIIKNFQIALIRHPVSTIIRAFILPVFLAAFLAYARNLFVPPSQYGIASSSPVRSLADALHQESSGRDTVAFVNSGFAGGDIDQVIASLSATVTAEGKIVQKLEQQNALLEVCKTTLRGVSRCYAAAVFYSSPNEGPGGIWNYTLRADGALGETIDVHKSTNDAELYGTPLQHTIDFTIASQNTTIDQSSLPSSILQYPYTAQTEKQRETNIRTRFMSGIIQDLAVAFFIAMVVVVYQLVGFMASEREMGMSQLIEAMMPNLRRWQPQIARLLSYCLAFHVLYTPGRLIVSIILSRGIFTQTSVGIIIPFHFLAGLSLSSWSIFGGAFFKKAQLSGISVTIISLLLGVVAQVIAKSGSAAIAILSLLFPPMNYVFFIIFLARWEAQDKSANLLKSAPESPWGLPGIVLMLFCVIHTIIYFILGALIERKLYGTASRGRTVATDDQQSTHTVELEHFTKEWQPNWLVRRMPKLLGKTGQTVLAVNDLTLTALRGQIYCLLGANGSGKSTTLDAICGLNTVTSGSIKVDGRGGLGVCPQKVHQHSYPICSC